MSGEGKKCAICTEKPAVYHVVITDVQGLVEDSDWFCQDCVYECMTSLAVRRPT